MSNEHIHPTLRPFLNWFAPPQAAAQPDKPVQEQPLTQADVDYLNAQADREERREREAQELDLHQLRKDGL